MPAAGYALTRGQRLCCGVILLSSTLGPLEAQGPSQLLGRWILEAGQEAVSVAPQAVAVRQSLTRTMERGPMKPFFKDVTIEREFATGIRSETYQIGVAGERVPSVNKEGTANRRLIDHSVRFEGQSLIIESGSEISKTPESNGRPERREVWQVEPDGRLKLTITTRTSNDSPKTDTFMYRRQGSADVRRLP
jgi:hypothetical protein